MAIRRTAVRASVLALLLLVAPVPGGAVGTSPATWTVTGSNGSYTGTLGGAPLGFPTATFTSDTTGASLPSSAFLNASTPFGAVFGSTQDQTYLNVATATGASTSTTTFTFDPATPAAGWGMAFGDIDADQLQIEATAPDGTVLDATDLGFEDVFNSCTSATPRPSACGGVQTDVPTWVPATRTLVGNVADTTGASAWFRPTARIATLTLRFSRLSVSGSPIFQMWVAATTATVSGTVTAEDDDGPVATPPGTTLTLTDDAGAVLGTTTAAADGGYAFPVVQAPAVVSVEAPDGFTVAGPSEIDVAPIGTDVSDVDFALQADPAPTTSTTTTTTTTSTTTTTTSTSTSTSTTAPTTTTSTSTTTSTPPGSSTSASSPRSSSPSSPSEPGGVAGIGVDVGGGGDGGVRDGVGSQGGGGSASGVGRDDLLARTGAGITGPAAGGVVLLVAGGGLALAARRRLDQT